MEMLPRAPEAISRRRREVDGEFPRHVLRVQWFAREMRDDVAPFLLGAAGLVLVVEDGRGDRAGEGEEDEPVAGGEAEPGETWRS